MTSVIQCSVHSIKTFQRDGFKFWLNFPKKLIFLIWQNIFFGSYSLFNALKSLTQYLDQIITFLFCQGSFSNWDHRLRFFSEISYVSLMIFGTLERISQVQKPLMKEHFPFYYMIFFP